MTFDVLGEATMPLKKLVLDEKNVNLHPARNIEATAASLKQFKQVGRVAVRKTDNVVFSGSGRVLAMRSLGWKTARVVFIEGTDDECRAFAVADNRTARLSEFDDKELSELLNELQANDPKMLEAAGYTNHELQDLLQSLEKPAKPKAKGKKGKAGMHATCPKCGEEFKLGA